ncbi:MAG: type II secretion system protein GspN [Myxococcales bacterium]|nr:type II secretion system protein GspN [Myxococcales bacterium]
MVDKRATLGEKLLLWAGYAGFFVFCFLLFAYWTFPYDRVKTVLIDQAQASSPGSKVEIASLDPHWLGVQLEQVRVETPPQKPGGKPNVIELDELTVSSSPIALAFGGTSVDFSATLGEGELEGTYSEEEEGPTSLALELDAVDVGNLGLAPYTKIPLEGAMTGELDVTLAKEPAQTEGHVELEIADCSAGDGKAKIPVPGFGGLTVPKVNLGTLGLKVAIKEGVATVEKLEAKGKDATLSGSGSVRLVQPFKRSRADLALGIKVDDGLTKREPKIKAMLGMAKGFMAPDGSIRLNLTGAISNLKAKAGAGAGKRGPRAGTPPKARRPGKGRAKKRAPR